MKNCKIIGFLIVFGGVGACARSIPSRIPTPERPDNRPSANTTTSSKQQWSMVDDGLPRTYQLMQQVNIKALDTVQFKQDTAARRIEFSMQRTPGIIAARINAVSGIKLDDTARARLPLAVAAHWTHSSISIDQAGPIEAGTCSTPISSVIPSITAAILPMPPQIKTGLSWTDTLSTESCAGSVRTLTKTIRRFRALSGTMASQREAITLEEQETSVSSGEGSEGQHQIQITASGTGTGRFIVDAENGSVLEATTETRTLIELKSGGRSKHFEQQVKGTLTRIS